MATLDTLQAAVTSMTVSTTSLLDAVNVAKTTLDDAVQSATDQAALSTSNGQAQVALAAAQVTLATNQVTLAAGQVTAATTQAGIATTKAGEAAASALTATNSASTAAANTLSQLTNIKTQTEAVRDQAIAGLGAADQSLNLVLLSAGVSAAIDSAAMANKRVTDATSYKTQTGTVTITQSASKDLVRTYASAAVTLPRAYFGVDYQVVTEIESTAPFDGCAGNVLVKNRATNGFTLEVTGSATSTVVRWKTLHPSAK